MERVADSIVVDPHRSCLKQRTNETQPTVTLSLSSSNAYSRPLVRPDHWGRRRTYDCEQQSRPPGAASAPCLSTLLGNEFVCVDKQQQTGSSSEELRTTTQRRANADSTTTNQYTHWVFCSVGVWTHALAEQEDNAEQRQKMGGDVCNGDDHPPHN